MQNKKAFFVGIKGVAMTALAIYLKECGFLVEGSDVVDEFATDEILAQNHIKIKTGFIASHIDKKFDMVVVTGAHGGMTNPEARCAVDLGFPTYMHGQALGIEMKLKKAISVAGCHGKTTTSSMIASLLTHCGMDPSYAIGTASIVDIGQAGHKGSGDYFVAESDEYMTCPLTDKTPRFMWQNPKILVLTNIEYDHPDAYKDIEEVKKAYLDFTGNLESDGIIIACKDDLRINEILPLIKKPVITYGFSSKSDYRISSYTQSEGMSRMKVTYKGTDLGEFILHVPGKHNLQNALASAVAVYCAGVSWEDIRIHMPQFKGSKRRFENIGRFGSCMLYDDYAHHPSEIKATLSAVKSWYPNKKLIVLFQPHTYSRTKSLLTEFAGSFHNSDVTLICDIYPSAREKTDFSISSQQLVDAANKNVHNCVYAKGKKEILKWLGSNLLGNELILTMGAGDIFLWHKDILHIMEKF